MLELICPQCQGQLTEVLDSDGGLFICRADLHGKVAPSFSREMLEVAQGIIFVPSQPLPIEEVRPTMRAADVPSASPVCTCSMDDGIIEFRTQYHRIETDECMALAIEAWNTAERSSLLTPRATDGYRLCGLRRIRWLDNLQTCVRWLILRR